MTLVEKLKIFYEKALGDLNSNTLLTLSSVYFICSTCGNTYENILPGNFDFCNSLRTKFNKIDLLLQFVKSTRLQFCDAIF